MNIFPDSSIMAILAGICTISYLYLGFYILPLALKEKHVRPLYYVCIFSAFWSICFLLYYHASEGYAKNIWQRFTFIGNLAFVYILWFMIKYTEIIKNKKAEIFLSFAIWIVPLISVYKSISENAVLRDFPSGFWFLFWEIQITVYNLAAITFLVMSYYRKKSNKSRIHAIILCSSALILMTASWLADYFLGFHGSLNMQPLWLLFWMGIMLFTVKKYRFIHITPEFIWKDITENIEEGIILLDPERRVIFKNSALLNMLNIKDSKAIQLHNIFFEKEIMDNEFAGFIKTDRMSFALRLNLAMSGVSKTFLADVRVKKIIDAYNDISGFLMIVSKVKNIDQLKEQFKISARELEVIHHIVVGNTNKEIAAFLDITESTIKTHIASIYNKLQIKNRVELLNLLAEFNCFLKN